MPLRAEYLLELSKLSKERDSKYIFLSYVIGSHLWAIYLKCPFFNIERWQCEMTFWSVHKPMDKKELPCCYISLPTSGAPRVGPWQVGETSTKNLGFCIFFESVGYTQSFKKTKWRVWSWLRMNASNMLNTCKLNAFLFLGGVANGWVMDRKMLCSWEIYKKCPVYDRTQMFQYVWNRILRSLRRV
jgi:hypothetical protein